MPAKLPFRLRFFLPFVLLLAAPCFAQTPPLVFVPGSRPTSPGTLIFRPGSGLAGVQGIQGMQGVQGVQGVPGQPGANAAGVAGIITSAPSTGLAATVGNGTADDTAALNAIFGAAQTGSVPVLLGTGVYPIATPLLLCRPTATDIARGSVTVRDIQPGFILRGLTAASIQSLTTTGNMIRMTGTAQDAVMQLGQGACYGSLIENITLDGGSGGTLYGIHTVYDYWSGLSLVNTRIQNVGWAVWIDAALGGRNGEDFVAYNCIFNGRLGCYKNTSPSGQALIHTLTSCSSQTDNGGTEFSLDDGQLNVFGWSCTHQTGILANVFLRLDQSLTGRANFSGGRCEHVDTLISWLGASLYQTGGVSIEGIDFVGMSGTKPFLSGGGTHCNYRFVIKRCSFVTQNPVSNPLVIAINTGGFEQIMFEDCDFIGWGGGYTQLSTNSHMTLIRCRYQDTSGVMHPLT